MKDKKTKKPIVITHFQGFEDEAEANDFSEFLRTQFILPSDYPNSNETNCNSLFAKTNPKFFA